MLKILINQSHGIYDKAHQELVPNSGYSTRQIIGQIIFKEEKIRQNHEAIKQNNEYFEVMIDTCHIKKDLRQINFCHSDAFFMPYHKNWNSESIKTEQPRCLRN